MTKAVSKNTAKIEHIIFIESPNKSKAFSEAISKIIDKKKFTILTTKGHIYATKPKLINSCSYSEIEWLETDNSNQLQKQIKRINVINEPNIYIATDNDREGEAIGWHISNMLGKHFPKYKLLRVRCNEIISSKIIESIQKSIENQADINYKLVNAYQCRILIDLLIGMNGSQIAWKKLYGCKSIGRVQSIAIYKIFENEFALKKFETKDLYNIEGVIHFRAQAKHLSLKIAKIYYQNKIINNTEDKAKMEDIFAKIKKCKFKITDIQQDQEKETQLKHLDTAEISTKCSNTFQYNIQMISNICKQLYEGIKITQTKNGKTQSETIGLITYPRTSATTIGDEAKSKVKNFIEQTFDTDDINHSQIHKNQHITNEAHEAIRVTSLDINQHEIIDQLNKKEKDVYKLILLHTVGVYMKEPINLKTQITMTSNDGNIKIVAIHKTNIYKGWHKLAEKYNIYQNKELEKLDTSSLRNCEVEINCEIVFKTNNLPERYSEGKLVKLLRDSDIGRPSTYPYILNSIKQKNYINKSSDNKLIMNAQAYILCYFIKLYLNSIINAHYTKDMEKALDDIASGKIEKEEALVVFFEAFKAIEAKIQLIPRTEVLHNIEKAFFSDNTDNCPNCNNKLTIKYFSQTPTICCQCGKYFKLAQFGYNSTRSIPQITNQFNSQIYTKTKRQTNKIKYRSTKK